MKLISFLMAYILVFYAGLFAIDEYGYCAGYDQYAYLNNPDCSLSIMLFLIQQNIDDLAERVNLQEQELMFMRTSLEQLRASLEQKIDAQPQQWRSEMTELVRATFQEFLAQHSGILASEAIHSSQGQTDQVPEHTAPASANSFLGGLIHYFFNAFKESLAKKPDILPCAVATNNEAEFC